MDGLLIVDKPAGMTSHDVVMRVRRWAHTKKVGHAGTLDPLATGVLVLAIGQGTRILEYLTGHDKQYLAQVRLGQTTTTYDAEGEILTTVDGPWPTAATIEQTLAQLRGPQLQTPPLFSAIKQGGEPLYAKARRGEQVVVVPRPVTIHELTLLGVALPTLTLRVRCSKGTYIRSLAHDVGQILGLGAYLAALRRETSGPFSLAQAHTLDEIAAAAETERLATLLLPLGTGLDTVMPLAVTADELRALQMGQAIQGPPAEHETLGMVLWQGQVAALLRYDAGAACWRPHKVLLHS